MTSTKLTKNGSKKCREKEDIVDLVKGEGPWQRWVFLMICLTIIPETVHNLSMLFLAPNTDHWCARPLDFNSSLQVWKDVAIPPNDQHCSRYKFINLSRIHERKSTNNSSNIETVACDSWEYDDSNYTSTVVSQWNLVCDREWLISWSKSIFIAGCFFQGLVFAHLSDKFGRKPVIVMCNILALVSEVISLFSVSFFMFAVTRFFIAVGTTGALTTGFVLLMEIVDPESRVVYGIGNNVGFVVGSLFLGAVSWWLRDWVLIQIAITTPSILVLPFCWLLPESPRWLLANGKQNEALKVLLTAAKANGLNPADIEFKLKTTIAKTSKVHEAEKTSVNIFQLFKPELWIKTSIICFVWCVIAFVYFGITYNTNDLAGDPFVNFMAFSLTEIPATVLTMIVTESKGRRNPLAISLVAAGVFCLLMYPVPNDSWWISVSLSLLAKFCITSSFLIVYLFTVELFPTVLRNVGLGSASMTARIGGVTAPFVKELGKATHPIVPQVIFGLLSVIAGFLVLLLSETSHIIVPDTLKDAAEITR